MAVSPITDPLGELHPLQAAASLTPCNSAISAWYNPAQLQSPIAPAHAAYKEATKYFSKHLTHDECKRIWLASKPTMGDAIAAVEEAKTKYENRSQKGKPWEWLLAFSSRVVHYKIVMDTLSQHHPEYVSLAWGAIKFLFVGLLNHEELIACIAKTLSRIAIVLPRVELDLNLYGQPRILMEVSQLYAHIIKFVQLAARWYQKGKIAHGVASILKPFQICGKEIVDEITECSKRVEQLAVSAHRAETRGMHLRIVKMEQLAMENHALHLRNIRDARNGRLAQILLLPTVKNLPLASESLAFQIAMRDRHRTKQQGSQGYAHLIPSLCDWASQDSRLLLVSGRKDPKSPRYFATDIIEGVQKSPVPIIWAFSKSHLHSTDTTLSDVLRMLTVQALQIPRSPTEEFLISPAEIEMTTANDEWLLLLKQALSGLKQAYIVIDTDILKGSTSRRDQHRAVGLMDKLLKQGQCIGLDLRIVLVARRFANVSESPNAEKDPQILRICSDVSDVLEKGNANRRSFAIRVARERASRRRTGCGRAKRFAGLAGQVLVDGAAPSAEIETRNIIPG